MDDDGGRLGLSRRGMLHSAATGAVAGTALTGLEPVRAQASADSLRLLSLNAWLLDPVELFGWHADPKPQMAERASELGEALNAVGYDIVGLCEVFHEAERERIVDGFDGPVEQRYGPQKDWVTHSGGKQTIVPNEDYEIVRASAHRYTENGLRRCDADAWSGKGVLHTEIDVGDGHIDLFTTHMFAGGGLPLCEDAGVDRYTVRAAQVEELTEFIEATARPENVTVIGGDFNITASDRAYLDMLEPMMDRLGVYDAWVRHGDEHGATNDTAFGGGCHIDPDDDLPYPCRGPADTEGRRIDYVFIEEPTDEHALELTVERLDRVTFWRGIGDPTVFESEPGVPNYLTDHMGLDLSLSTAPTGADGPPASDGSAIETERSLPLGLGALGGAAVTVLGAASAGAYRHRRTPTATADRSPAGSLAFPLADRRALAIATLLSLLVLPGVLVAGHAYRIGRAAMRGDDRPPALEDWGGLLRDGLTGIGLHLPVALVAVVLAGALSQLGLAGVSTLGLVALLVGYVGGAVTTAWIETGDPIATYRDGRCLAVLGRRTYAVQYLTLVALLVGIAAVLASLAIVVVGACLLAVHLVVGLTLNTTLETVILALVACIPVAVGAAVYATFVAATAWGQIAERA